MTTDTVTTSKPSAAIKIDHLPFGFFEREIAGFFAQFGAVVRVRVPRSKKTGRDRGYAFVLFDDDTVAQVAMEAMDGYLMFEKKMVVTVMAEDKVPECLKKGAKIVGQPNKGAAGRAHSKKMHVKKSDEQEEKAKVRRNKAATKRVKALAAMGIDYDMDGETKAIDTTEVTVVETVIDATPATTKRGRRAEKGTSESDPILVEPTPKRAKVAEQPAAATPKVATPAAAATPKAATPKAATPAPKTPAAAAAPTPKGKKTPAGMKTPSSAAKITPPLKSRLRSARR